MKKKQKDNLIKAFEELGQPDKDVLLGKIEGKKAFGGGLEQERKAVKKSRQKRLVAWTSFACSFVVIAIGIVLISVSIFGGIDKSSDSSKGEPNTNVDAVDYRESWKFRADGTVSFDDLDGTVKDAGVELMYDYWDDWTIVETQVTQDESAYREYYVNDGVKIEVTLLLAQNVTAMDGRYYYILNGAYYSFVYDKYRVYRSQYTVNGAYKQAYVIYLKDQVYIFTSDTDLRYLFAR